MKPFLTVLFTLLSYGQLFCQGNWNNWYFGNYAGLNFSPNSTVPISGQTTQLEGSASISDNSGNLLFYTDGRSVWDRNHNLMPNGSGLEGGWSTSQSALIVPIPGQPERYYLFTVREWDEPGNLTVSAIDMRLNNGLGDVETTGKNQLLATQQTEKLVSATAPGCGVWVITHQRGTNVFESRLVSAMGIGAPVYSSAGSVHSEMVPDNLRGVMKVSRDNRTLALATPGGIIELFRFDPSTGIVSDPIAISTTQRGYGVCFSPGNSKLYITEGTLNIAGYDISQFDLSIYTAVAINGSRTFVGRATQPSSYLHVGDLQAAPDGKIYFTKSETYYLGCIPSPNLPAPLCGFIDNGIYLGGNRGLIGLPNEIRSADTIPMDLGNDTALCADKRLVLNAGLADNYLWSNGETGPQIEISSAGEYFVEITRDGCKGFDTIIVDFQSLPGIELGNDTSVCTVAGYSILPATTNNIDYLWQDGSTNASFIANNSGQYWLQITDQLTGCVASDTITLDIGFTPYFTFGDDIVTCQPGVNLDVSATASSYLWNTGSTDKSLPVSTSGLYWLQLNNGNCFHRDSIEVTFNNLSINIGRDTTVCDKAVLVLGAGNQSLDYTWQDGSKGNSLNAKTSGLYIVTASDGVCTVKDSVLVNFSKTPVFNLGEDQEFCNGDVIILGNSLSNSYSYIWEDGSTSPIKSVNKPGTFKLTATNECGSFTDEIIIKPGECVLAVPNAFTPDGDGKNDVFRVSKTTPLSSFNMQVFNRWGQKIFESRDQSKGWNGSHGNKYCDPGNYPYVIQYRKADGSLVVLKGILLLIR